MQEKQMVYNKAIQTGKMTEVVRHSIHFCLLLMNDFITCRTDDIHILVLHV